MKVLHQQGLRSFLPEGGHGGPGTWAAQVSVGSSGPSMCLSPQSWQADSAQATVTQALLTGCISV